MNKKLLIISLVLVLMVVGYLWIRTLGFGELSSALTPTSTPERSDIPSSWETYSSPNLGFSIKYDPTLDHDEDSEIARFYYLGPTQSTGTEIYDGLALSFYKLELNTTLDDYINQQIEQIKDVGQILEPVRDVVVNGMNAKTFVGSGLGTYTFIFFQLDDDNALMVSYIAPDPGNRGYQEKINLMLSTLELIK